MPVQGDVNSFFFTALGQIEKRFIINETFIMVIKQENNNEYIQKLP